MKSMLTLLSSANDEGTSSLGGTSLSASVSASTPVRVKELGERDRRRLLTHFLSLNDEDRMLRFGSVQSDDAVTRYVQKIDLERDAVFGVYDDHLQLIGVGHLAFAPKDATPLPRYVTVKARIGELGISVLPQARGKGVGTKLFERAAMHCRNEDIDSLIMHCLSSNHTMMHIACKAGMQVKRCEGEAQAYLTLSPADPGSILQEAMEEQVALFDYRLKANLKAARWFWRRLPSLKKAS